MSETNDDGEPFGSWLLGQKDRKGWIGDLAKQAKSDRSFSRDSTPDDLRKRMRDTMAEGDMFEVVDDAETAWLTASSG